MPLAAANPSYKAPTAGAQMRNHKFDIFPAPVLGLDISAPFTQQDPKTATVFVNFIARRYGSETRGGFRRHASNVGGVGTPSPVCTLMAYQPPRGPASTQLAKLFASCEDGNVYDVTSQTNEATAPSVSLTPAGTQNEPGHFSFTNFATGNTNYLCIASAGAGYFTYDDAGGWVNRTASLTGSVTGINVDFVMVWKNRLWFIEENSTRAHYLGVGLIQGATAVFDFGPLLIHGGELRAMASWTVDSGDGVDDKLVLASSMGDVLVYAGTDPTALATFAIVGRWYIGPPPAGRTFMSKYGGDLAVLCENGVESMNRLMQAAGLLDPETQATDTVARRYNEVIGREIRNTRSQSGWNLIHVPSLEAVIVSTPYNELGVDGFQFCFSTIPIAWSSFIGMPMKCAELFDGELFFGTPYGTICKAFVSDSDDELTDGTVGTDVVASLQTAFIAPNEERMQLKRPQLVMPMFQAKEPPSVGVQVNTEWSGEAISGSPTYIPSDQALWDVAQWDQAVWGGSANTYLIWVGASGLGCYMSLRLSIIAKRNTLFTSWKLIYEPGGVM